jgi:hypothetical protein
MKLRTVQALVISRHEFIKGVLDERFAEHLVEIPGRAWFGPEALPRL